MSKLTARLPLIAAFLVMFASFTVAQEATPDAAKQQEEKAKLEAKATALLEQIVSESQGLKLPENRIRVPSSPAICSGIVARRAREHFSRMRLRYWRTRWPSPTIPTGAISAC